MKNILNQEVQKPVYLFSAEECIKAVHNNDSRIREIAKHFYIKTGDLLSNHAWINVGTRGHCDYGTYKKYKVIKWVRKAYWYTKMKKRC